MMTKNRGSDDDDDLDRPSPLFQTQRFTKSGTVGTKDFKTTQSKPRSSEVSRLKLDLKRINDDEDDSLNDSDDDSNTKTSRSTSSATASQLTPKPKERSFLRKDGQKPTIKPRHMDDDEDDDSDQRNVFGKTKAEPSPTYQILSAREEEERNQSFIKGFSKEKRRQSPIDMFSVDQTSDSRRSRAKFSDDPDEKKHTYSDEETLLNRHTNHKDYSKSRRSPTSHDKTQPEKYTSRSKDSMDHSENEDDLPNKQSKRQDFRKEKQSSRDSVQSTDSNTVHHQSSSSRPGSGQKQEVDSARRSSFCEDQETAIPPISNQKLPSRPTSAKSITARQQTESAIEAVAGTNAPSSLDPITANNETLAAALQPSSPPSPPPRASSKLPPKPKSDFNATKTIGINKKKPLKVPSRYQEIRSRIDSGRTPISTMDLSQSVERALEKELQAKIFSRPQSARSRRQSENSNSSERQRRRSSSAYEHVQPRVNTNRSINFDELNTSQMRNDSSQSIKDAVYFEWLKSKETKKKHEQKELKRWQQEKAKLVDKTTIERRVYQNAQNLERWRQEKEEQIKQKRLEELRLTREQEENKKRDMQQKKKDAKDGFDEWKNKKEDELKQQLDEQRKKKTEIETQQEEKQKKILEAEKAYKKWMDKKAEDTKKSNEAKKHTQNDQLKKLRENEETKFISAQEAYEKWLQEKEKYEIDDKMNSKRRNSLSAKQQQVPFLPGGSQKNTGKIRHAVW